MQGVKMVSNFNDPFEALGKGLQNLAAQQSHHEHVMLRQEAELTTLSSISDFTEKYSKLKSLAEQSSQVQEDANGVLTPMVNLSDDALKNNPSASKYNKKPYHEFLSSILTDLSTEAVGKTNNKYAKLLLKKNFLRISNQETLNHARFTTQAKDTHISNQLNTEVHNVVNRLTPENFATERNKLLNIVASSGMGLGEKQKTSESLPRILAEGLLSKLLYTDPDAILTLNKESELFKHITPNKAYRYMKDAADISRGHKKEHIVALESQTPNVIKAIEEQGSIDQKHIIDLSNLYKETGQQKKLDVFERKILKASYRSKYNLNINFKDLEQQAAEIHNAKPKDIKAKDYAVQVEAWKEASTHYDELTKLKYTDPAKLVDQLSQNEEVENVFQNRLLKGSPRILSNADKQNMKNMLDNADTPEDFQRVLSSIGASLNQNKEQAFKELASMKEIHPLTSAILEFSAANSQHNTNAAIHLLRRVRNGDFEVPSATITNAKTEIAKQLAETPLFPGLSSKRQKRMHEVISFAALQNVLDGQVEETEAIKLATQQYIESNNHIEDEDIVVPKTQYTVTGPVGISKASSTQIASVLIAHKKDEIYWTEDKVFRVFRIPNYKELSKPIRKNNLEILRERIEEGQWRLTDDSRGYYLHMYEGEEVDERGKRKIYSLDDVSELSLSPNNQEMQQKSFLGRVLRAASSD